MLVNAFHCFSKISSRNGTRAWNWRSIRSYRTHLEQPNSMRTSQFLQLANHPPSFIRAISPGNWSLKRFKMERARVTHFFSRLSFISALGMVTRISSQFAKKRRVNGPRTLQPIQWCMSCPSDTPEGEACVLVKDLVVMTHITMDVEEEPILGIATLLGVEDGSGVLLPSSMTHCPPIHCMSTGTEIYRQTSFVVHINSLIVGITRFPARFVAQFHKLRRGGKINDKIVNIASDGGRIYWPLIIVEHMRPKVTSEHIQVHSFLLAGSRSRLS